MSVKDNLILILYVVLLYLLIAYHTPFAIYYWIKGDYKSSYYFNDKYALYEDHLAWRLLDWIFSREKDSDSAGEEQN